MPPPVKQVKKHVQDAKERLYDLEVGPWQNRVDQDLEATKRQIEKMNTNQKEIKQELMVIADTLAILAREKEEKEEVKSVESGSTVPGGESHFLTAHRYNPEA